MGFNRFAMCNYFRFIVMDIWKYYCYYYYYYYYFFCVRIFL